MFRYKILGNSTILVDLQNGYEVMAIGNWQRESDNYKVYLFLKENNVGILDGIEPDTPIIIDSTIKELKRNLATCVTNLFDDGFFTKYIDRYKYMMDCFERGNEYFENERMYK